MIEEVAEGLSVHKSHDDQRSINANLTMIEEVAKGLLVHKSHNDQRINSV